jgi:hypothetical protein
MRLAVVLVALVCAGCGVLDEKGPATRNAPDPAVYGPSKTTSNSSPPSSAIRVPPVVSPSPSVAAALDAGTVGVVDLVGTVGVKPVSLDTAADLTVEGLTWTSWSASGASGSGRLRMLTCQPNCAIGGAIEVPARVVLSDVKTCDGRRYFDHAEVRIDPEDAPSGMQPASYLRAPC